MNDIAIRVENLGKRYRIGGPQVRYKTLRESIVGAVTGPLHRLRRNTQHEPRNTDTIWALKDVSFEVRRGEVVGIIGRNGAGKSTLLKILSRITEPTEGYAEIHGRVGSLLEVGTGFHPELTGRENIYLNGAILGMRKHEIDKKFDEIVAFAEIEKFLDTPVKHYSSGMYVRLAFAVAAHLEPEILLVDEVLAVGDAAFQKKCLGKMGDVAKEGRTVLFVSHNMPSVQSLCKRVLLLETGTIRLDGDASIVISHYLAKSTDSNDSLEVDLRVHPGRSHSQEPAIEKAWLLNKDGEKCKSVMMGESLTICFQFRSSRPIRNPVFGFGVEDQFGRRVFSLNNYMVPTDSNVPNVAISGVASLDIPTLPLLPGTYFCSISLVEDLREWVDFVEQALVFQVHPIDLYGSGRIPEPAHGVIFIDAQVVLALDPSNCEESRQEALA